MAKARKESRKPGAAEWQAALILHDEHGWSVQRIAEDYGVSYWMARDRLRRLGAKRPSSPAWHSVRGWRIYSAWLNMRQRCLNPASPTYRHYGGRGIGICAEWDDFAHFYKWAVSAGHRVGHGLALIDRDRDFGPKNCYWIGAAERKRERRSRLLPKRTSCMIPAFGETKNIEEWARDPRCRIAAVSLARRLRKGVDPEAAISSPPRTRWDKPLHKARKPQLGPPGIASVDWDHAVRLYRDQALSPSDIAEKLGAPYSTVCSGLKHRGILKASVRRVTPERHRLHLLWRSLWSRTTDPNHYLYRFNGAIGVRVCKEWEEFEPFFVWAKTSGSQPNLCLARIRRRGPYSPTNCEWITRAELAGRTARRKG